MRFFSQILSTALLLLSSSLVKADDTGDEGWGGCVDPEKGHALVTIGEKTTVCLVIANRADWSRKVTYMRVHFQPIADEYSRFHVPNSYKDLVGSDALNNIYAGKNITVHAASQKSISFQKRYYDSFEKVYPHLTAVIDVEDGVVKGISWDDACIFCGGDRCEPNTFDYAGVIGSGGGPNSGCYLKQDECDDAYNNQNTDCDLLLYVVWTGTDSAGNSFLSSSYRFSAFPPQELADQFSENLPTFPKLPGSS